MRLWLLILCHLGIFFGLPLRVVAQEAPLLPPTPTSPAPWEIPIAQASPAPPPPVYLPSERSTPIERNPLLDIDFLLGVPIAARVGLAVFRHDEQALLLEAMGGLDYLVIPFVAAGARYRFVAWHNQHTELVIKPGIDGYVGVMPFIGFAPVGTDWAFPAVGGDVACVFLHNGPHLGFEWGVDLGAIGIINGGVVPLASFILGLNF